MQKSLKSDNQVSTTFSQKLKSLYAKSFIIYNKVKQVLWIFTTGCLLIVVPISFAIFMETEFELQKLIQSQQMAYGVQGAKNL